MKQKGFAALLIIFILGMVSILVASGLILTGYNESQMARSGASGTSAYYVANSGVEDAIYKLNKDPNYAALIAVNYPSLSVSTGNASYTVSPVLGNNKQRTIDSVGTMGSYVSRIHALVENTSVKPGFEYAVQGGTNGVEINNSKIEGDVYSNGYIKGNKASVQGTTCKDTGTGYARITGTATAVGTIGRLDTNDTGPCITEDAIATNLDECYVFGSRVSPNTVSANCDGAISPPVPSPAPTPAPLPLSMDDIQSVYNNITGTPYTGTCTIDGTSHLTNCGGSTNTIGNIVITGDLIVSSNNTLRVSGPVWVKGNIVFNSNVTVTIAATVGQIVVTERPLISSSNTAFDHNGNAYLLFISTYTLYPSPSPTPTPEPSSAFCNTPAITISSNTQNVLFFAPLGCALINSNATFKGSLVAEKVKITNNSTVTYDSNLANAVFSTSQAGGWQIASFSQL